VLRDRVNCDKMERKGSGCARMKKLICLLTALLMLCLSAAGLCEKDIELPSDLTVIEAEAFRNVPMEYLVIPEGTKRIESKAFAGCGIKQVVLADSLEYIAPDAFGEVGNLWVKASSGSYAEAWAKENNAILVIGLDVASRSQAEISAFIKAHPASTESTETYRREPSIQEPLIGGLLSEKSNGNAINMLNQIRYIAGLNADVVIDHALEEKLSAASLIHALNDMIDHYPRRPTLMADAKYDQLYADGRYGAACSNLADGPGNLADALLVYMYDSYWGVINSVGHRRWILSPKMTKTAFGFCGAPDPEYGYMAYFSAMYAFDESGRGGQTTLAWPAAQTPLTHFYTPEYHAWHVSLGRFVTESAINVTLVSAQDGKTWRFNTQERDGIFYVDNDNIGLRGAVIFRPSDIVIQPGSTFYVAVEDTAKRVVVQYSVTFFNP